ncbi:MAG: hypothetical protein NTU84_11935, partial [Verrucomicrobia bacterium]|nr:hypothetical protein [Verrucomicrobiota bacterium]
MSSFPSCRLQHDASVSVESDHGIRKSFVLILIKNNRSHPHIKGLSLYRIAKPVTFFTPATSLDSRIPLTFTGFSNNKPASRPANFCIKAMTQAQSQSAKA